MTLTSNRLFQDYIGPDCRTLLFLLQSHFLRVHSRCVLFSSPRSHSTYSWFSLEILQLASFNPISASALLLTRKTKLILPPCLLSRTSRWSSAIWSTSTSCCHLFLSLPSAFQTSVILTSLSAATRLYIHLSYVPIDRSTPRLLPFCMAAIIYVVISRGKKAPIRASRSAGRIRATFRLL